MDFELNTTLIVPEGFDVNFDLNGKNITEPETRTEYLFINQGTFAVKDSVGTGSVTGEDKICRNEETGNMTIENGKFITRTVGGRAVYNKGTMVVNDCDIQAAYSALDNEGTVTINGGKFYSTSCVSCAAEEGLENYYFYSLRNYHGEMYIYDCTLDRVFTGGFGYCCGYSEIYDGKLKL